MFPYGTKVRSIRHSHHGSRGIVVGFGTIMWPADDNLNLNGDQLPMPVYLVQVTQGSSSMGIACAVLRADQVIVDRD